MVEAGDFYGWRERALARGEVPKGDATTIDEILARAHDFEALTRGEQAGVWLRLAETEDHAWRRVRTLVDHRLRFRRSPRVELEVRLSEIEAFAGECDRADDKPSAARAWYLAGLVLLRLHRAPEAETALTYALERVEKGALMRLWILDAFGQTFAAVGAFEEARRTFERVAEGKRAAGDVLGVAITVSHLAELEIDLGLSVEAEAHAAAALVDPEGRLVDLIRVRLVTVRLLAYMRLGDEVRAREVADMLAPFVIFLDDHRVRGLAALALARSAQAAGKFEECMAWLGDAERTLAAPEHLATVWYWRAAFAKDDEQADQAIGRARELAARAMWVTEAEIATHLLSAARARTTGDDAGQRHWLDLAYQRAVLSNNAVWLRRVDAYAQEHDGSRHYEAVIRRFTGERPEDLPSSAETDASIVFVDLVGFTPRSEQMSAAEVMHTVRCLFELTMSVLAEYRVQPLSYRGDGLLACARGESHELRALSFARDFARRAARVTKVRYALGDTWGVDVRGGVAAGPVVFGVLGNLFKLEFVVNGFSANLAARLQSAANPNEVVCDMRVAAAAHLLPTEELVLKGINGRVPVARIVVSEA